MGRDDRIVRWTIIWEKTPLTPKFSEGKFGLLWFCYCGWICIRCRHVWSCWKLSCQSNSDRPVWMPTRLRGPQCWIPICLYVWLFSESTFSCRSPGELSSSLLFTYEHGLCFSLALSWFWFSSTSFGFSRLPVSSASKVAIRWFCIDCRWDRRQQKLLNAIIGTETVCLETFCFVA